MRVKVHYLFSKNEKIGSKLISWGTKHLHQEGKIPSHIALLVDERWVIESTLFTGVRIIPYSKWLKINEEVAKIPCPHKKMEYSKIKKIFKEIKNKKYDWPGVLYLTWRILINKYFNEPIPTVNLWENPNKYFCSEAVAKIHDMSNHSMKTPVGMLVELRK